MRLTRLLISIMLISALFFTGCAKDEESITLLPDEEVVIVEEDIGEVIEEVTGDVTKIDDDLFPSKEQPEPEKDVKEIPRKIVKRTMTKTSSTEEAAKTMVGIPFLAPLPRSIKSIIRGTTTAGDTAARMLPRIVASSRESLSK